MDVNLIACPSCSSSHGMTNRDVLRNASEQQGRRWFAIGLELAVVQAAEREPSRFRMTRPAARSLRSRSLAQRRGREPRNWRGSLRRFCDWICARHGAGWGVATLIAVAVAVWRRVDAVQSQNRLGREPRQLRGSRPRRWAKLRDLSDLAAGRSSEAGRFSLGSLDHRQLQSDGESHVVLVAPTRSGKTIAIRHPMAARARRAGDRHVHED